MIRLGLLGEPPEFRRHGPRLQSAAHVSPRRRPVRSGPSLARVAPEDFPWVCGDLGPIRLPPAPRRALRSPLRPPTRQRGKREGLPGCSRTLVPVPMPSTPAAPAILALADSPVRPSTLMTVSAAATWPFSGLAHLGPDTPCLRFHAAVALGWQDSVPAWWLAVRRLGFPPTGFARRVSERYGPLPRPLATALPGRFHQPGLGPHHVGRHRQLRPLQDDPELLGPRLAQPMGARPPLPLALREAGHGIWRWIGLQELPRQDRRQLGHLQAPRVVRLERIRQLVDQARLLPDLPLAVLRKELELLGRFRARLQGLQTWMIRAQEVGQHSGVKGIALRPPLAKPIPGPVQRLRVHRVDHDAMVEQEVHDPALGPLNGRPELEPLRSPLVQLPAPLDHPLRRVRHRARGDLRPALIPDPDRMRLIRPIDSEVVAHSPLPPFGRRGRGAGTAGSPYTGPPGDHFLWNLRCRSLADRDSLPLSLRRLGRGGSSDQQAPGRHTWPPMPSAHTPLYSGESHSPGVRTEYKAGATG